MKKIALLMASLMFAGFLTACATPSPEPAPEVSAEAAAESEGEEAKTEENTEAKAEDEGSEAAVEEAAASTGDDSLQVILDKGTLVIGTSADYPPYEFHQLIDGKDEVLGFDIQLAEALAAELGVELKIVDMNYDGLLTALAGNQVDMVMAAMTPTEERKASMDFSDIYYQASQTMLVRKADAETYTDAASLAGKKVGVQKGSLQEGIAADQFPESNAVSLAKVPNLILELVNKKVEGVILETAVAQGYLTQYGDELAASNVEVVDETGGTAIAMRKGSDTLVAKTNEIIAKLQQEGKTEEFMRTAVEQASIEE